VRTTRSVTATAAATAAAAAAAWAADGGEVIARVREWRVAHERAVIAELADFVAIPNVEADPAGLERNARHLAGMLERRGLATRLLRVEGAPPAVFGELRAPGATRTVVFYAHYDGQPVVPEEWSSDPFAPVLRAAVGGKPVEPATLGGPLDPESRLFGRSAADDKAPIVALVAALDALRAAGIAPTVNLKVLVEGEEERGSPHLARVLRENRQALAADVWLLCDGPVHQTRRPQIVFGVRGVMSMEMTVYGAARALHSGHYGNWSPDPAMALTHLLRSMRAPDGSVRLAGVRVGVGALGPVARAALAAAPPVEEELRQELALGWSEGEPATLAERLLLPAMNVLGIASGQVGAKAANAIPTEARAVVSLRLVPELEPARVRELVEAHVRAQGFTITHDEPSLEFRRANARVIRLAWREGYPAHWTDMELPVSRAVVKVAGESLERPLVVAQSMGGSLPLYVFGEELGVPLIVVPTVNHDNNQHAADENLRLGNLWDAIDLFAGLLARFGGEF
jgi:acetylornithine deacetylase/succinyl-diaminopimelate desuccinylase-like protein